MTVCNHDSFADECEKCDQSEGRRIERSKIRIRVVVSGRKKILVDCWGQFSMSCQTYRRICSAESVLQPYTRFAVLPLFRSSIKRVFNSNEIHPLVVT